MDISVPWAIALATAGIVGVVVILAIAARRGAVAMAERRLGQVAYLLGGGVTGFLALAFYPSWPILAAVVGMLLISASRAGRMLNVGLLVVGFGSAWSLLGGFAVVNDLADPAVTSPGAVGRFALGVAVLLAGLAISIYPWVARAK